MIDFDSIIGGLALKAVTGDTEAVKALLDMKNALNYELLIENMDDDEFSCAAEQN